MSILLTMDDGDLAAFLNRLGGFVISGVRYEVATIEDPEGHGLEVIMTLERVEESFTETEEEEAPEPPETPEPPPGLEPPPE